MSNSTLWSDLYSRQDTDYFLIHAFGANKLVTMQGLTGLDKSADRAPYINLAEYPEKIRQRDALSCSLIKADKNTHTWGPAGIVLKVPPEDIIATSSSDLGTYESAAALKKRNLTISAPDELLALNPMSYNEVVIEPARADIAGFFIKTDVDGKPVDPVLADVARRHSLRLGKPLVEIKNYDPFYRDVKLEIFDNEKGLSLTVERDHYQLYNFEKERYLKNMEPSMLK